MKKVKFSYKHGPTYNVISPTDAWGIMNPKGMLEMNLFTDVHTTPEIMIQGLDTKGQLKPSTEIRVYNGKRSEEEMFIHIDRLIHSKVIMSAENSVELALWILRTVIESPDTTLDIGKLRKEFDRIVDMKGVKNNGSSKK